MTLFLWMLSVASDAPLRSPRKRSSATGVNGSVCKAERTKVFFACSQSAHFVHPGVRSGKYALGPEQRQQLLALASKRQPKS